MRNLVKVHRVSVRVEQIPAEELQLPDEKLKEISATVASMRLDAVAAMGFGISRTKMAEEIVSQKVKLNWSVITDCSRIVGEGDTISIRGKGRVEIAKINGETKKGRIFLVLKRYL